MERKTSSNSFHGKSAAIFSFGKTSILKVSPYTGSPISMPRIFGKHIVVIPNQTCLQADYDGTEFYNCGRIVW